MKIAMTIMMVVGMLRTVVLPTTISGNSMDPTLASGDLYFANQLAYLFADPQRGDIVFARDPADGELVVKRVIGLPGEEIKMIWGRVYVNGTLLEEPYRHPVAGWCMLPVELAENEYWVIGDNRDESCHMILNHQDLRGRLQLKEAQI